MNFFNCIKEKLFKKKSEQLLEEHIQALFKAADEDPNITIQQRIELCDQVNTMLNERKKSTAEVQSSTPWVLEQLVRIVTAVAPTLLMGLIMAWIDIWDDEHFRNKNVFQIGTQYLRSKK